MRGPDLLSPPAHSLAGTSPCHLAQPLSSRGYCWAGRRLGTEDSRRSLFLALFSGCPGSGALSAEGSRHESGASSPGPAGPPSPPSWPSLCVSVPTVPTCVCLGLSRWSRRALHEPTQTPHGGRPQQLSLSSPPFRGPSLPPLAWGAPVQAGPLAPAPTGGVPSHRSPR